MARQNVKPTHPPACELQRQKGGAFSGKSKRGGDRAGSGRKLERDVVGAILDADLAATGRRLASKSPLKDEDTKRLLAFLAVDAVDHLLELRTARKAGALREEEQKLTTALRNDVRKSLCLLQVTVALTEDDPLAGLRDAVDEPGENEGDDAAIREGLLE